MPFQKSKDREPIVFDVDPFEYHQPQPFKRGSKEFVMSKSALWKFRACPRKWLTNDTERTDEMDHGSLVDCLATCPQDFGRKFAVMPQFQDDGKTPWDFRGNRGKKRAELEDQGLIVIKHEQHESAKAAIRRLNDDAVIAPFLRASDMQVQLNFDYLDTDTGILVPMRALLDYVPRKDTGFSKYLGDLKTTNDASHEKYERTIRDQGWHYQGALYLDAFNFVADEARHTFVHVVSETKDQFEPARRMLSEEFLELGRMLYRNDLKRYARCLVEGFGGYDDVEGTYAGWSLAQPTKWMLDQLQREKL